MKHTGGALLALMILAACGSDSAAPIPPTSDGGPIILEDGAVALPPAPEPVGVGGKAVEGVFVSASKGIPGADASAARPLKTIAEALPLAAQKRLPIIVCAENYPEQVKLLDGVTLYGYFDCSNLGEWVRTKKRAVIASPISPAFTADGLTLPARIEGFEIVGPDFPAASAAGVAAESSTAMFIRGTSNLTMAELTLRGGKAQDGHDGAAAPVNEEKSARPSGGSAQQQTACSGQSCLTQVRSSGLLGGTSQCLVGASGGAGGKGGDGPFVRFGEVVQTITSTEALGKPTVATATTAVGGLNATGANINSVGSAGSAGAVGALGANGAWGFNGNGFLPGAGAAGGNGAAGQGGGGGGGGLNWMTAQYNQAGFPASGAHYGIAGAGGGAGGCGGVAGEPGEGGGASVGLLVISSTGIKISASRIEAGKGGRAGKGADGSAGLLGSSGGLGRYPAGPLDARGDGIYGLAGGAGGKGGAGGMSGHGSPGPSIALVFNGSHPDVEYASTQVVAGAGGEGHPALTIGAQTRPAVVGVSTPEHSF